MLLFCHSNTKVTLFRQKKIETQFFLQIPIQISVYKDKIMIWNYGQLPEDWTTADLLAKHSSQPYNPDKQFGMIAGVARRNLCANLEVSLPHERQRARYHAKPPPRLAAMADSDSAYTKRNNL
jgi:hypothetical protein